MECCRSLQTDTSSVYNDGIIDEADLSICVLLLCDTERPAVIVLLTWHGECVHGLDADIYDRIHCSSLYRHVCHTKHQPLYTCWAATNILTVGLSACGIVDVGGDVVRLSAAVCRGVDGAISSAPRPYDISVVRQATTLATRQQPQQLRTNGSLSLSSCLLLCLYWREGSRRSGVVLDTDLNGLSIYTRSKPE